jgi:hypothetical protein
MKNVLSVTEPATYRILEVDGQDDDVADTRGDLHRLTFFNGAGLPDFDWGHWWLAFHGVTPVAFAGLVPSTHADNAGYLPGRRAGKTLRPPASIAADACDGIAGAAQWLALRGFRYHRQSGLSQ